MGSLTRLKINQAGIRRCLMSGTVESIITKSATAMCDQANSLAGSKHGHANPPFAMSVGSSSVAPVGHVYTKTKYGMNAQAKGDILQKSIDAGKV